MSGYRRRDTRVVADVEDRWTYIDHALSISRTLPAYLSWFLACHHPVVHRSALSDNEHISNWYEYLLTTITVCRNSFGVIFSARILSSIMRMGWSSLQARVSSPSSPPTPQSEYHV